MLGRIACPVVTFVASVRRRARLHRRALSVHRSIVRGIVLWVAMTMVNIVTGFFIGCLVGVLSLGLWVAIVIVHIVCIVKGVGGQRLIIPGISQYADKF